MTFSSVPGASSCTVKYPKPRKMPCESAIASNADRFRPLRASFAERSRDARLWSVGARPPTKSRVPPMLQRAPPPRGRGPAAAGRFRAGGEAAGRNAEPGAFLALR